MEAKDVNVQEENDYFFEASDTENWLNFLDSHGYCVLKSQANETEVNTAKSLLWNDIERIYEGVDQKDESSWGRIPTDGPGIIGRELPQTLGPWTIRGLESIRNAFANIWKTDELLVSMDSIIIWLPWWKNSSWKPYSEGLHIDQNPFRKPDKCCVQGMVPLLNVTDITGGLEVIPKSHLSDAQTSFKLNHPYLERGISDWCVLKNPDKKSPSPILLKAKAGDLILWDSRLLHGGRVGTGNLSSNHEIDSSDDYNGLARIAIPVCMTPRSFASQKTLQTRKRGYLKGATFNHWPHEAVITSRISAPKTVPNNSAEDSAPTLEYTPLPLPPRVLELI